MPIEIRPSQRVASSVVFHCCYCKAEIFTDGSYHYTTNAVFGGRRAFWQDGRGLFYCLNADGDYILPHKPLVKELLASADALMAEHTTEEPQDLGWEDELSEKERSSFERWAAGGSLTVSGLEEPMPSTGF
jgi:hypothetical protein